MGQAGSLRPIGNRPSERRSDFLLHAPVPGGILSSAHFANIHNLAPLFPPSYRYPPPNPEIAPLPQRKGVLMSTPRQIEANRRNAQKSTGPTSVTGKAASAMNALKTGIHAQSLVLPPEDPAEFDELVETTSAASIPPPPKPAAWSTSSSTASGTSAASVPPKPNRGNTSTSPPSTVPLSTPGIFRHRTLDHLLQTPVPHGRHPPRPRTRPPVPQATPGRSRRRPCRARPAPRTARARPRRP